MKKTFRGFTLIECIIALAILGIASLTMAQIYANVSLRNRNNALVNTSLANQMKFVEKYTNSEAYAIYYQTDASGKSEPDEESQDLSKKRPPHIVFSGVTKPSKMFVTVTSDLDGNVYSYPADIYVLNSREYDSGSPDGKKIDEADEKAYSLRYKYLMGHENGEPVVPDA